MPRWVAELTRAELTRSAATSSQEPEQLVLLEFTRRQPQPVMIGDLKGGIARHAGLIEPCDRLLEMGDPDGTFPIAGRLCQPLAQHDGEPPAPGAPAERPGAAASPAGRGSRGSFTRSEWPVP